jgi:hypothetical protein
MKCICTQEYINPDCPKHGTFHSICRDELATLRAYIVDNDCQDDWRELESQA